jgi:hypothetical protein
MDSKSERQALIIKINSKLKKISDKVNYSKNENDLSEISILFNVNEELEDILLNWEGSDIIPSRISNMFKNRDPFDLDED